VWANEKTPLRESFHSSVEDYLRFADLRLVVFFAAFLVVFFALLRLVDFFAAFFFAAIGIDSFLRLILSTHPRKAK
jgi:hypothetical protein